jgi:hypothetical protein
VHGPVLSLQAVSRAVPRALSSVSLSSHQQGGGTSPPLSAHSPPLPSASPTRTCISVRPMAARRSSSPHCHQHPHQRSQTQGSALHSEVHAPGPGSASGPRRSGGPCTHVQCRLEASAPRHRSALRPMHCPLHCAQIRTNATRTLHTALCTAHHAAPPLCTPCTASALQCPLPYAQTRTNATRTLHTRTSPPSLPPSLPPPLTARLLCCAGVGGAELSCRSDGRGGKGLRQKVSETEKGERE